MERQPGPSRRVRVLIGRSRALAGRWAAGVTGRRTSSSARREPAVWGTRLPRRTAARRALSTDLSITQRALLRQLNLGHGCDLLAKPRRLPTTRAHCRITGWRRSTRSLATTGDDPELDTLILRLHTEPVGAAARWPCEPRDLDCRHTPCCTRSAAVPSTAADQPCPPPASCAYLSRAGCRRRTSGPPRCKSGSCAGPCPRRPCAARTSRPRPPAVPRPGPWAPADAAAGKQSFTLIPRSRRHGRVRNAGFAQGRRQVRIGLNSHL